METKKFDVGIVGYWYATNYGSTLTYYALSEAIKKIGYTTVLIDRPEKETDREGEDVFSRKFLKTRCNISESVRNGELGKLSDLCDTFVVGSDQVWTKDAIRYFGYMFFLSFVDDTKNKIAYAPSFGKASFDVSEDVKAKVYYYLHRFNNISVREDTGKQLLKKDYDIDATHVLDPVFLLDAADYVPIAQDSRIKTSGDYILAYILDPTEDIELYLKNVSNKLKMNIKIILDGRKGTFENNKSKFALYDKEILSDVDVTDWVKLFLDAQYVLTDSHHGLAMAIIFNKNFICYANYRRGYTRFTSLLTKVGLLHRMINNSSEVTDELLYDNIDYAKVKERFQVEIDQSKNWLKKSLAMKGKPWSHEFYVLKYEINELKKSIGFVQDSFNKIQSDMIKLAKYTDEEINNLYKEIGNNS